MNVKVYGDGSYPMMGLEAEEMTAPEPSPTDSFSLSGHEVTKIYKVAWDKTQRFMQALSPRFYDDAGTFMFVPGHRIETRFKNRKFGTPLYANYVSQTSRPFNVAKTGHDAANAVANYEYATVSVTYENEKLWATTTEATRWLPYITEEKLTDSAEFITQSNRKLYWDAAQVEELETDEAPGRIVVTGLWDYTIKHCPFIPSGLDALKGKSNSASMYSPKYNKTFAVEEVVLLDVDIEDEYSSDGNQLFNITYKFGLKEVNTWNKHFKAGETTPVVVYDAAGVAFKTYPTANLTALLVAFV